MNIMYTSVKLCKNVMISDERKKEKDFDAARDTPLRIFKFPFEFPGTEYKLCEDKNGCQCSLCLVFKL